MPNVMYELCTSYLITLKIYYDILSLHIFSLSGQNWIPEEAGVFIGREFQDKVLQKFVSKIIKCG